ncbi:hypothetical protein D3C87_241380 [compost metagenome]
MKKGMLQTILSLGVLAALTACHPGGSADKVADKAPEQVSSKNPVEGVQSQPSALGPIEFSSHRGLNQNQEPIFGEQQIIMNLPNVNGLEVRRIDLVNNTSQQVDLDNAEVYENRKELLVREKTEVLPLRTIEVRYDVIYQGAMIASKKFKFLPDMQIEGQRTLANYGAMGVIDVDMMVFRNGGVLITEGADVRFNVKYLFANFGVVKSFDRKNLPLPVEGVPGRSGGLFDLYADEARGFLNGESWGLRGADGENGRDSQQKGENGLNGTDAKIGENFSSCRHIPVSGSSRYKLFAGAGCERTCSKKATSGAPGKMGGAGEDGGAGQPGGFSGRIFVVVKKSKNFRVSAFQIAGEGGEGGKGGSGAVGGDGGLPGKSNMFCGGGQVQGAKGQKGPDGKNGKKGDKGVRFTSCWQLGLDRPLECY